MPHPPFFWGMVWTSHPPFFLGMEAIPKKKKGAKKGGSSFFYTDGPRSPFFFKAILQKIEGSPFFSFFFCGLRLQGSLCVQSLCWDIVGLLQGSKMPLCRKPRNKSEKGFLGPLGPGAAKNLKRVEKRTKKKTWKSVMFRLLSRARKPWSANCELKHWNFRGWKCLIHGLHFTV